MSINWIDNSYQQSTTKEFCQAVWSVLFNSLAVNTVIILGEIGPFLSLLFLNKSISLDWHILRNLQKNYIIISFRFQYFVHRDTTHTLLSGLTICKNAHLKRFFF